MSPARPASRRHLPRVPACPRGSAALALALAVALAAGGCSGGGDDDKSDGPAGGSRASDSPSAGRDVTTVTKVSGGQLGDARRQQMKKDVAAVVDGWIDNAYLGSFPRTDYTKAFADFTPQAAALAQEQLDLMSNQSISDKITKATATDQRIRLTVFAPRGLPRGVTARIVLDFHTSGDLEQDQRVLGQLYLTKPKGKSWQVFGFRVDQAVKR